MKYYELFHDLCIFDVFKSSAVVDVLTLDGSYEGTVTDVAGEIVEVGQDVQKFKVGDKVVAILPYGVSILQMPSFTYKIHVFVTK